VEHPFASRTYLEALANDDPVFFIDQLDTWALIRKIPESQHLDAAGPYPFTQLSRVASPDKLRGALRDRGLISFVAVTEVNGDYANWAPEVFDWAHPYKAHFVIDRSIGPVTFSKHHRYEIRKAAQACDTRLIALCDYLDNWCSLYDNLTSIHRLDGIHSFSRSYFETLARMKECVTVGAFVDEKLVSAHIWLRTAGTAVSHLAASSKEGYACGAAYAVNDFAISMFEDCKIIDLGGVADSSKSSDGLRRFKKGFTNDTRHNWICGAIADRGIYETLCRKAGVPADLMTYFPAYRAPTRKTD
jgi:hypothetical protein